MCLVVRALPLAGTSWPGRGDELSYWQAHHGLPVELSYLAGTSWPGSTRAVLPGYDVPVRGESRTTRL